MHMEFLGLFKEIQKVKTSERRCKAKVKRNKNRVPPCSERVIAGLLCEEKIRGELKVSSGQWMVAELIFHESKIPRAKQPNRRASKHANSDSAMEYSCFQLNF